MFRVQVLKGLEFNAAVGNSTYSCLCRPPISKGVNNHKPAYWFLARNMRV